jgi:hypothetical protein
MKTFFKVVLFVFVSVFYSCGKDDNASSADSSITSTGVLSGTIVNYNSSLIDSLKADYYTSKDFIGKCRVASDGKFSLNLSIPVLEKIGNVEGLDISDTTALTASLELNGYLKDVKVGEIMKSNYTTDSLNKVGMCSALMVYVDRPITMKGETSDSESYNGLVETYSSKVDLILKKGWNEITNTVNIYSKTKTNINTTVILSNNIGKDLQWIFIQSNFQNGRSNVRSLQLKKSRRFFFN